MDKDYLMLKRATRITPSGELKHDDYDVLCDDHEGGARACRIAVAVEAGLWPPRRPHADLRL
jgi:hypothetical protein